MEFKIPYGKKSIALNIPEKNIVPLIYKSGMQKEKTDISDILNLSIKDADKKSFCTNGFSTNVISSTDNISSTKKYKKPIKSQGLEKLNESEVISLGEKIKEDAIINEDKIIEDALNRPIKSPDLIDLAKTKSNVCILVSDITRPCPSYKFLPFIIKKLKKAKVKNIDIIFGLGIHRKHTPEEMVKLAGDYAAKDCNLIDFDINNCKYIGQTKNSTPIEVFKKVLDCDLKIATGNIEYHYFAGYSGGAKAVMPGVCSKKSVSANHSMMLKDGAEAARFYNNPVRDDIEQVGQMVGIDFIFNVILDDNKKIIAAVSGKNNEAYLEGIKLYDEIYEISVNQKADIVITSAGGYPKDLNLYQAQKAIESVKNVVKKGGKIILVAECQEGFGEDVFEEWMKYVRDFNYLYERLKKGFVLGGHKAVAMAKVLNDVQIYQYTDKSFHCNWDFGFEKIDNIQAFIDNELKYNNNLKIIVVPNGRFIKFA